MSGEPLTPEELADVRAMRDGWKAGGTVWRLIVWIGGVTLALTTTGATIWGALHGGK